MALHEGYWTHETRCSAALFSSVGFLLWNLKWNICILFFFRWKIASATNCWGFLLALCGVIKGQISTWTFLPRQLLVAEALHSENIFQFSVIVTTPIHCRLLLKKIQLTHHTCVVKQCYIPLIWTPLIGWKAAEETASLSVVCSQCVFVCPVTHLCNSCFYAGLLWCGTSPNASL